MHLAIYGRGVEEKDVPALKAFFGYLIEKEIEFTLEEKYLGLISPYLDFKYSSSFAAVPPLKRSDISFIISMGGDGTLLDTLNYVKQTSIPVLGINLGRLGFLSNVSRENSIEAIDALIAGRFSIEKRALIELHSGGKSFGEMNFALNEFTIHKSDTGSMVTIDTYLNGEFFTSYWADGLIVATPTGSTAYSLSCGGPIIFPDAANFVICPVAPHNLNIRPIIVPDSTVISFKVRGRGAGHLISLDSRHEVVGYSTEIAVQKAQFFFHLVKLNGQNFINTLREKLSWGLDSRNF
jgi:NAD+ kinase